MNETVTIMRNLGVSREEFDAQQKKRAAAHALASPYPDRSTDRFINQEAGDDGAKPDDDSADLAECCKNGSLEHLTAARDAISGEIERRSVGTHARVRFVR